MAFELDFSTAEEIRQSLTEEQQKEIQQLYKRVSRRIGREASKLPNTTSGVLRKLYLKDLQKKINEELKNLRFDVYNTITKNMESMVDSVVLCNLRFLVDVHITVEGAFSHVAPDVINSIISGKLYSGNWSLSKSLWQHTLKSQKDINKIIAEGILQNKGAYDIAKDLEKYVNPFARKSWEWAKVYPGTSLKVDYNAQRLARTMVSHAYEQSFVRTTQNNPFVTKYRWDASNSSRVCELCASRDGVLFDKDKLPLDHPNGMCTFIAVMPDSMETIADRVADWVQGNPDPELDKYVKELKST